MRLLQWSTVCWVALAMAGCEPGQKPARFASEVPGPAKPWTSEKFRNDPADFQFAIVSDRNGGCRPGVFASAMGKLNLLQPEFVLCVGDLIDGYTQDRAVLTGQWDEFDGIVKRLEMPFFRVPGNHDITNPVMAEMWRKRYGPAYYHFVYGNVLFLVVNTEDTAPGTISDRQVAYMHKALAANPSVRWTMVFMHQPVFSGGHAAWEKVEAALKARPHTVFAGHHHTYSKYRKHDRSYIKLSTTGGGSALRGLEFGEFDHVVWVTITDGGPRIANLLLDGIHDEDVATAEAVAFYQQLAGAGSVESDAVFADGEKFTRARVKVRLLNKGNIPLRIRGTFAPHASLSVSPSEIDVTVPPMPAKTPAGAVPKMSVEIVDVEVRAAGGVSAGGLSPLRLAWTSTGKPETGKPVSIQGEWAFRVLQKFACPPRKGEIVVDGKLNDWKSLPVDARAFDDIRHDAETYSGPEDCRYRFGVAHDENFLYLAIETTDDKSYQDPKKWVWLQDGVEIRLCALPEPARSASRGLNEGKDILAILTSPAAAAGGKMILLGRESLPKGTKVVCVKTARGHNTEVAIPVSYLNAKQGGAWKEFRLNVAVDDFDGPKDGGAQLWWRPDWRYEKSFPGSGTFRRK